ncbi:MAG TPA: NAD(P)/FAD-dependent oxidoreductase [Acidimicrobiia bacterium]|nr:NAD(P)/FAD-dependent oxidoreductase [Acidimicrobiia bacterium]
MTTDYDVVIVGARVAGAMTALHLARAGHRVLIVDRAGPPADTLSTHALMRTAVLQLTKAGLLGDLIDAGTPAIRRLTLGFGLDVVSFDVRSDYGVSALYAPRRTVLDPIILSAAQMAGAEVGLGRGVTAVTRDGANRVNGVVIGQGRDEIALRARYVIGADGRYSTVARLVGAVDDRVVEPTAASVYSYYSGMPDNGFDFRFGEGGTAGTLSTNDGLTLVWAGVPIGDFDDPASAFERTLDVVGPDIARAAAGAERVERLRFTRGIKSFLRTPTGPGWALVGDAGFTKDPLSAHGISCALRDSEFAAEAVATGLAHPELEHEAGVRYATQRDRFAVGVLESTAALASYRWTPARASDLMRQLGRLTDAECEYLTTERHPVSRVA